MNCLKPEQKDDQQKTKQNNANVKCKCEKRDIAARQLLLYIFVSSFFLSLFCKAFAHSAQNRIK